MRKAFSLVLLMLAATCVSSQVTAAQKEQKQKTKDKDKDNTQQVEAQAPAVQSASEPTEAPKLAPSNYHSVVPSLAPSKKVVPDSAPNNHGVPTSSPSKKDGPTSAPKNTTCLPNPDRDFLLLPRSFFLKAQQVMTLSDIVSREMTGPIDDQIEQHRQVYEFFDGWTDINDQAVVAKTRDRSICYAVFQATEDGNLLGESMRASVHLLQNRTPNPPHHVFVSSLYINT